MNETVNQMSEKTANTTTLNSEKVFSIKDLKADSFGAPILCATNEEAIRACKIRLLYDQGSLIQQFPADYMLYHVGYFNTKTGVMESTGIAMPVISILDVYTELEQEKKNRPVDVPEFMKGDKDDDRSQEPSVNECSENS